MKIFNLHTTTRNTKLKIYTIKNTKELAQQTIEALKPFSWRKTITADNDI
jgi:hypothetical protein